MKALDIGLGHLYFDVLRNEQMIEFHIDYRNRHKQQEQKHQQRNLTTIEARARPISIAGQDESVFAQYLLGSKQ
jgi:hypothetical protein